MIRSAKEQGIQVTCEVAPHHLFLTSHDLTHLASKGEVRPKLTSLRDQSALWENMELLIVLLRITHHTPWKRRAAWTPLQGSQGWKPCYLYY
ncbi:hypothetical protein Pmani_039121 [Petrolisthes manimaculis]|uniref:Uncharacterized protein n=1 Tax=Petrolisthes manimaculis TaxID=1843537 RepID=A0AAE1NEC7_9EUCA|nr:hypothetical protein Pmani_039121 [Petrolisthes manimaculis]